MAEEVELADQNAPRLFSPETGPNPQVLAYNEKLMLVRHLMGKVWVGARHSHLHEQLVYVIRGQPRSPSMNM